MMFMPSIFGENLFDNFFDGFDKPARREERHDFFRPGLMKTDVKESDAGFDLDIELPGFNKEDISAELKDGYMTISAETKKDEDEKDDNGRYIRRERFYGSTSRSFYVGEDITEEDIKAKFENGVLKLFVPKKEAIPQVETKKLIAIE